MCAQRFDIVVFGASGFTGIYVVEEIARTVDEEQNLKWAIAGRSASKLKDVLKVAGTNTGKSLESIPIITADIRNDKSLNDMCSKAKIILNCVGPYRLYGEPVIKACIANKCHHLDLCGEPGFLDKVLLEYDEAAKEAGVFIIGACGWDSIPAEMGVAFVKKKFSGDLSWVESYVSINIARGGGFNFGTWQSAIHSIGSRREDIARRRALLAKESPLPKPAHRIPKRGVLFRSRDVGGWCTLFPGSDKAVVERTQRFSFTNLKERPVQFKAYFRLRSFLALPFLMLTGIVLAVLSQFSFGRWLLETFPRIFTFGLFSSSGPSREGVLNSSFTMTLLGEGYSTKASNPAAQHTEQPDKRIKVRVSGPEPGYISTPICLVQSAYTLLAEIRHLPMGGGVLSPGSTFSRTSLIERLNKHGIKFELIDS